MIRPALLLLALLPTACSSLCPREEPLLGRDGGTLACVQSTDCPRPSSVLVCADVEDRLHDCIDCVDARCVRFHPEACP